jgi:hypothetical protein
VHPFFVIGSCSSEVQDLLLLVIGSLGDLGDRGDLRSLPRCCGSPKEILVTLYMV